MAGDSVLTIAKQLQDSSRRGTGFLVSITLRGSWVWPLPSLKQNEAASAQCAGRGQGSAEHARAMNNNSSSNDFLWAAPWW